MVSVGVLGASGYGGGELLRLLADHPQFEVGQVWANASAGQSVAQLHPHLATMADLQVAAFDAAKLDVDFVFMALPHSQSAQYAAEIEVPVVDLGADFRLQDAAAWSAYYGGEHAGTWTYGLPEIPGQRTKIAESTKVANPGAMRRRSPWLRHRWWPRGWWTRRRSWWSRPAARVGRVAPRRCP